MIRSCPDRLELKKRVLFHCKPVNQQKTTIFALILWKELRLNRFWSEKRCQILLSLWAAKKVSSLLLLTHSWWRKNITASPCGRDGMVVGSTTICDKVCQLLAIRDRSVVFSGSLHQYNWPPRHNWNIVEYIQWSPIIEYYSIFQSKRV
jgi:hypothetical protein